MQQTSTEPQSRSSTPLTSHRQDHSSLSNSQNDTSLLMATNDVTLALKRTHALLEQELEKSTLSLETLNRSSKTLEQLEHRYGAFDVLIRGSKRLIIELEQADKWDRWRIYAGMAVFGLTCLWIIYKRILRGPLGILIWIGGKAFKSGGSVSVVISAAYSTSQKNVISATRAESEVMMTDHIMTAEFDLPDETEPLWSEELYDDALKDQEEATVEIDNL
jgi:Sec20